MNKAPALYNERSQIVLFFSRWILNQSGGPPRGALHGLQGGSQGRAHRGLLGGAQSDAHHDLQGEPQGEDQRGLRVLRGAQRGDHGGANSGVQGDQVQGVQGPHREAEDEPLDLSNKN